VQAYEAGIAAGPESVRQRTADTGDSSLYRLRGAADVALHGQSSYRRQSSFLKRMGAALSAVGRVFLPVLLLLGALAASYLYLDTAAPVQLAVPSLGATSLTMGHLMVPLCFFSVVLTNRRYGATYAFAQVVIALALAVAAFAFQGDALRASLPAAVQPGPRILGAFAGAFLLSSLISILVFDGARGPSWWTAPLLSLLVGGVVFTSVFAPLAFAGTGTAWIQPALNYGALLAGAAVALLIPYWMLRGLVPPLSGFGGY
jgi:uncharacterized PurR-regulated membrane protein YhhQ (DUF165 family)